MQSPEQQTKPPAKQIFGPHFVLAADGSIHGEDTEEHRELVRRIHACMNACDGISTEELEAGIIKDICQALSEVVPVLQGQADENEDRTGSRKIVVNGDSSLG